MTTRNLHVLLVEADEDEAALIEHAFDHERSSALVTRARSLREARHLLRAGPFDVVLVDIQLQDGSGLDLLRCRATRDCPFLLLTDGGDEPSTAQAIKCGAFDSVCKNPQSIKALPRIIQRARREFHLRRESAEAQQALRRSEQRYRVLVEGVNAAVWEYDCHAGRFTFVSQRAEELLGYPRDEWYEPTFWYRHLHDEDRENAASLAWSRTHSGQEYDIEYRMIDARGRVVWVRDLTSAPHEDEDGRSILHGVMFDITERKRAEEAIRQTEHRLATLLEQSAFVLYELSPQRAFFTENIIRLTGFSAEVHESARTLLPGLVSPRDRIRIRRETRIWRNEGQPGELILQYRLRRRDGVWRWVEDRRVVVPSTSDGTAVSGFMLDITDQKDSEQRLRFQAKLLDQVRESVIATDLAGRITYWGKGAANLYGYAAEEMMGKEVTVIVPPDEVPNEKARMQCVLDDGYWSGEYPQQRKDGTRFWGDARIGLVSDADGRPSGLVGVDRDITPRRRAEAALRESERRFRQLAESIDEAFFLLSPDERELLYISPVWLRMTGQAEAVLREDWKTWMECLHPHDRVRVEAQAAARGGGHHDDIRNEELRFRRADGSDGWMWVRSRPVRDEANRIIARAGVAADVTERRRAEEEARGQAEKEVLLRRELNHRIRNMLMSLISLADLMAASEPGADRYSTAIRHRILTLSAVHAVLSASQWRPVDLQSLLKTLLPLGAVARVELEGPPIDIAPRQVQAVGMVVNELLTNSAKYGALSGAEGQTLVRWMLRESSRGAQRVAIFWEERGGPPIERTPVIGVGLSLVEGFVHYELGGSVALSFPPPGVSHRLEFVLGEALERG